MSNHKSDEMMTLLGGLAALKQIDRADSRRTREDRAAYKMRQEKRVEIRRSIKQLAKSKSVDGEVSDTGEPATPCDSTPFRST